MDWRDDRVGSTSRGENPTVLAELSRGFSVMGDVQFLPGYCVLLSRNPSAQALVELPREERVQFLAEVDLLATAVERACRALDPTFRRINIDILENTDAFVHAHMWPRHEWEPPELLRKPVWLYDAANWSDAATALGAQHDELRAGSWRGTPRLTAIYPRETSTTHRRSPFDHDPNGSRASPLTDWPRGSFLHSFRHAM